MCIYAYIAMGKHTPCLGHVSLRGREGGLQSRPSTTERLFGPLVADETVSDDV